jgi:hypothetical protein
MAKFLGDEHRNLGPLAQDRRDLRQTAEHPAAPEAMEPALPE